jgi:hypothetical protein
MQGTPQEGLQSQIPKNSTFPIFPHGNPVSEVRLSWAKAIPRPSRGDASASNPFAFMTQISDYSCEFSMSNGCFHLAQNLDSPSADYFVKTAAVECFGERAFHNLGLPQCSLAIATATSHVNLVRIEIFQNWPVLAKFHPAFLVLL